MKRVLALWSICLSVGFLLQASPSAFAQARPTPSVTPIKVPANLPAVGINLTLSPTFVSVITDPGKPVTREFSVRNNNSFRDYLQLRLVKYQGSPTGGLTIEDVPASDPFLSWISFSEQQFVVDANESKTIRFTISPPANAALGYYYAIGVSRIENNPDAPGGAAITGTAALPILLEVRSPNAKREVQLSDFKTDKVFYEYLPVTFNITIKNTGNVHVVPVGDIFIDWGGKKDLVVLNANKGKGNVLPGTERTFTVVWDDAFATRIQKTENGRVVKNSKGETVYTTKYDVTKADKFRFGRYTANLLMIYDNGERDIPLEASISFWVFPWKIVLGIVLISLFALFGIFVIIRSIFRAVKK